MASRIRPVILAAIVILALGAAGLALILILRRELLRALFTNLPALALMGASVVALAIGITQLAQRDRKDSQQVFTLAYGERSVSLSGSLFAVVLGIGLLVYLDWSWRGRDALDAAKALENALEKAHAATTPNGVSEERAGEDSEYVTEAQQLLRNALDEYSEGDFDEARKIIASIRSADPYLAGTALFYDNLCMFHILSYNKRHFLTFDEDTGGQLRKAWVQFEALFPKHRLFPEALYWSAQTELLVGNETKALDLMERVIDDYPYSRWIEGSLYYSALLLHKRGDDKARRIAIERMQRLSLEHTGELLRLVEVGHDTYAGQQAAEALTLWGVATMDIEGKSTSDTQPISSRSKDVVTSQPMSKQQPP